MTSSTLANAMPGRTLFESQLPLTVRFLWGSALGYRTDIMAANILQRH